jgi:hypothetical protein
MDEKGHRHGRAFAVLAGGATTVLVAALFGSTLAASANSKERPGRGGERTLAFVVHFSPFNVIDLPPAGLSVGDVSTFHDQLLDDGGHQVGVEAGVCPVTQLIPTGVEVMCSVAVSLTDGQITLQGLATNAPDKPLAVTGGTGRYRTTRGDAALHENGDGTGTLTLHLVA